MSASAVDAAIVVEDVSVRYGATTAVQQATFTQPKGSVLALLGPNGAGKTTLLQVCEGFRRPSAGRATVLGVDPYLCQDWLMCRVGVMLQAGGAYPGARAGEMLALLASFAAHPVDIGILVDRLELGGFLRTRYTRLSGGQRQRLSLAMALVGRPELVVLDEPTAGMDVQARHATWALIEQLRADGVSVLLTTHLLDEAERLADQVVIIDRGRVIAAGTPAELTAAAGIERLEVDAEAGLPLWRLKNQLRVDVQVSDDGTGRYTVTGPLDTATVAAIMAWLTARDAHVTALHTHRRTLEDVFLTLTEQGTPHR